MKKSSLFAAVFGGALLVAASSASAAEWYDSVKVDGRMFFNVSDYTREVNGTKTDDQIGFDVKRFYIGVSKTFSDRYYGNITTDINYSNGNKASNNVELMVKKAYFGAKFNDKLDVKIGASDMAWIPYVEGIYGYRYFENTTTDKLKYGNSADWGAHVSGKLNDYLSYQVSLVNGGGYKNPSKTQYLDVEGRVNFVYNNFNFGLGGYSGKLGKDTISTNCRTANRFNALAAYKADRFTAGLEYFKANDWGIARSAASDSAEGYSVFGSYRLSPAFTLFGRYDQTDTSQKVSPVKEDKYYTAGVSYSVFKNIDFSLAYKRNEVQNTATSETETNEFGVWAQYRF